MRSVRTICVSLEPQYVDLLDRLAARAGSKSEALRRLLDEHEERRRLAEMEEAYREYFSDPENVRREREITREMRSMASLPEEWKEKGRDAKKSRPR